MAKKRKKPQPATAKFFRQRLIKTSPNPRFYHGTGNTDAEIRATRYSVVLQMPTSAEKYWVLATSSTFLSIMSLLSWNTKFGKISGSRIIIIINYNFTFPMFKATYNYRLRRSPTDVQLTASRRSHKIRGRCGSLRYFCT